jgi:hypothetical protein
MVRIPSNVLAFANGKTDLYEGFVDYWRHYRNSQGDKNVVNFNASISLDEKESKINKAMLDEIKRVAQVGDMTGIPVEQWASHPVMQWASFAVVSALIDTILPETMIDSIGLYTEVKTGGFGDSFQWTVKPRDLFYVTKAGYDKRAFPATKQFNNVVTMIPEPHAVSVQVSLARVLAGKEDLGTFVMKAARSMETEMTKEAYSSFYSAMEALPNTATTGLRVAGYTQDAMVDIAQRVQGWNMSKAIVVGTARALNSVIPATSNIRYDVQSDFIKIGYFNTLANFDLMVMPQIPDWQTPFGTLIANNRLWIISPAAGKPVKLCIEGSTLSNTDGVYSAADLSQKSTLWKSWTTGIAASHVAGIITLS